eukprot:3916706-Alexandrium_andersonii.AAC.1
MAGMVRNLGLLLLPLLFLLLPPPDTCNGACLRVAHGAGASGRTEQDRAQCADAHMQQSHADADADR